MNESSVDMTRMSPGESLAMAKRRERIQEGRDLLSKRSAELAKRRKRLEVKPWYILRPDAGVVAFRDMLSALAPPSQDANEHHIRHTDTLVHVSYTF